MKFEFEITNEWIKRSHQAEAGLQLSLLDDWRSGGLSFQ
jgi:hypothetical protein